MSYDDGRMGKAVLAGLAAQVAASLGDGWSPEVNDEASEHWGTFLIGPDVGGLPARVLFSEPWGSRGRLTISGCYPHSVHGWPREVKQCEITVNPARGAATIGKEITRRLLPGYLGSLQVVADTITARNGASCARRDTATRLAMVLGVQLPSESERDTSIRLKIHIGPVFGHVDVGYGGDSVRVELYSVPVDAAEALLRALARTVGSDTQN